MSVLQAGRQIGQGVRNLHRLRQVVSVFARHGFVDIVDRMSLGRYLPSRLATFAAEQAQMPPAERLKLAFEELGPTFVKFGQLLSTRPDIIPENFVEEFTKLQDNVAPLPGEIIRKVIEAELGRPISEAYLDFSDYPIASASVGQVHAATLHSGEQVVIKVQRPDLEKVIEQDLNLLTFFAGLLEKYIPESRVFSPKTIVNEFFRTLSLELDYAIEANNMIRFSNNMASIPEIVIPRVYKSHCTSKVLTQQRLDGIRVNDLKALDAASIDRKLIVEIGARAFFRSVMIDGLFHGDLHGGNLFILPGNRLGIIDFGIVGRLSEKSRDRLAAMMLAIIAEDYESLCFEYAELGNTANVLDFDGFQREVQNTLSPYLGLTMEEVNVGKVLIEATRIATRYQIQIPGDWMIVFKAMFTVEGMARNLDPQFDMLAMGKTLVGDLAKNQFSSQRIAKEATLVVKDLAALMQVLPRQLRWMLKKFNSNDFAFEIKSPDVQNLTEQLTTNTKTSSLSLLTSAFFISAALSLEGGGSPFMGGYSLLTIILFSFGVIGLMRLFLRLFL